MSARVALAVTIFLSALAISQAQPAGGKGDQEALQGTWIIAKVRLGAEEIEAPKDKEAGIVFAGNRMTFIDKGKVDKGGTFTIDATKTPKTLNFAEGDGKNEKNNMQALYKLDGDTLTIAMSFDGKRPESLDSKKGMAFTLTRKKK